MTSCRSENGANLSRSDNLPDPVDAFLIPEPLSAELHRQAPRRTLEVVELPRLLELVVGDGMRPAASSVAVRAGDRRPAERRRQP